MHAVDKYEVVAIVVGMITTAIAMRPIEYVLRDMRKAPKELHRLLECYWCTCDQTKHSNHETDCEAGCIRRGFFQP